MYGDAVHIPRATYLSGIDIVQKVAATEAASEDWKPLNQEVQRSYCVRDRDPKFAACQVLHELCICASRMWATPFLGY